MRLGFRKWQDLLEQFPDEIKFDHAASGVPMLTIFPEKSDTTFDPDEQTEVSCRAEFYDRLPDLMDDRIVITKSATERIRKLAQLSGMSETAVLDDFRCSYAEAYKNETIREYGRESDSYTFQTGVTAENGSRVIGGIKKGDDGRWYLNYVSATSLKNEPEFVRTSAFRPAVNFETPGFFNGTRDSRAEGQLAAVYNRVSPPYPQSPDPWTHRPVTASSPAKIGSLENFANVGSMSALTEKLSQKAEPEQWSFGPVDDRYILTHYIKYTFLSLYERNLISYDSTSAVMNTGLFGRRSGENIYMIFDASFTAIQAGAPWKLRCLYERTDSRADTPEGINLLIDSTQTPMSAQSLSSKSCLLFDPELDVRCDMKELLLKQLSSISTPALRAICHKRNLHYVLSEIEILEGETARKAEDSLEELKHRKEELRRILTEDADILKSLCKTFDLAFSDALRRARANPRLAVPGFDYNTKTAGTMLLPLYIYPHKRRSEQPDTVAVLQNDDGHYVLTSILPFKQAYLSARLLGSVESSWLKL